MTSTFRKKFGRGYILDFSAFQDEMSSYVSTPSDDTRRHTTTATTGNSGSRIQDEAGSSGKVSPDSGITVDSSYGENSPRTSVYKPTMAERATDEATESAVESELERAVESAMESAIESEMEPLPKAMKRMMSVSRTGRCKRKDRQRISVLDTANFYGANNNNSTFADDVIADDIIAGSRAARNEAEEMTDPHSPILEFSIFGADSDQLREYSNILPDYFDF